jgi:pyruvate dehydrogenase E1 component alpha subunit
MTARPQAFGIPAVELDGQDVRAVYAASVQAVERARRREGPTFLLCNTYRFRGHHVGDINRTYYRPREEEQAWMSRRDPLTLLAQWLAAQRWAEEALLKGVEHEVRREVAAGLEFALNAPYPDASEVDRHVYA